MTVQKNISKASEYHTQRQVLRRAVHAESQRQTQIQECLRQDTRGMRRKAGGADQNHASKNRRRKEKGKTGIAKGATTKGHPSKLGVEETKNTFEISFQ